jgi:perosamine synthetase
MTTKKSKSDFRYSTGDAKVPWDAVAESYTAEDASRIIRFLMQGEGAEYDSLTKEIETRLEKLADISRPPAKLSLGPIVEKLEAACDEYLGASDSLFMTNATAGFEIAYKYANLKEGDEVIVPAITFIATMAYPLSVGAKVVIADVDPITLNMDPADVAKKITSKTKMIVPVHIGGYPCS